MANRATDGHGSANGHTNGIATEERDDALWCVLGKVDAEEITEGLYGHVTNTCGKPEPEARQA